MSIALIAEIGWNHMGDMALLEKMVKAASASGATHAKFQTFSEKNLKPGPWDTDGRREIYIKAQLSREQHVKVKQICEANGILFMTSIFNAPDAAWLADLNNAEIKIPSPEMANEEIVTACSKLFKKVYISTGAATEGEIDRALEILRKGTCEIVVMHCVSMYPCGDDRMNLGRINLLKKKHPRVGLSDHTSDILSSLLSLPLGIEAIEKHFTVDHDLPGRDNKFAILPEELSALATGIRRFEAFFTDHGISFQEGERELREKYRGRWTAPSRE